MPDTKYKLTEPSDILRVTFDCPRCGSPVRVSGNSWNDVNKKLDEAGYKRAPAPFNDLRICDREHGKDDVSTEAVAL